MERKKIEGGKETPSHLVDVRVNDPLREFTTVLLLDVIDVGVVFLLEVLRVHVGYDDGREGDVDATRCFLAVIGGGRR